MGTPLKQRAFYGAFWLIFILVVVLSVLPLAVRMGTVWWLEKQGLEAHFKHLDLALLPARITIEELSWRDQHDTQFALDELLIDISWNSVFGGPLQIESLEITGLSIDSDISINENSLLSDLFVAGIAVPIGDQNPKNTDAGARSEANDESPAELTLLVDNLKLQQWRICNNASVSGSLLTAGSNTPQLIKSCLQWQDFNLAEGLSVTVGKTLQAAVPAFLFTELNLQVSETSAMESVVELKELRFQNFTLADDIIALDFVGFSGFELNRPSLSFVPRVPETASWGALTITDIDFNATTSVFSLADLTLEQLAVVDRGKKLLQMQTLSAQSLGGQKDTMQLGQIVVTSFSALERDQLVITDTGPEAEQAFEQQTGQELGPESKPTLAPLSRELAPDFANLVEFDLFTVAGVSLAQSQPLFYSVDKVELLGPRALIAKNGHNQWLWQSIVDDFTDTSVEPKGEVQAAAATSSASSGLSGEASAAPVVNFQLGELTVAGESKVVYHDGTTSPPVDLALSELRVVLGALSSQQPKAATDISIATNIGEFGSLNLSGTASPLAEPLNMQLSGQVSDVALHPASPYLRQFVGQRIRTGQLSQDITINVVDDQLDSLVDIKLHKLKLTGKPAAHEGQEEGGSLLPIGVALNLLRDGNDRIRLKLPIRGDVHDPSISPNQILAVVLRKALTEAVLQYYSPFGLVSLARFTLDQATKLRFKPLLFVAGSGELPGPVKTRLDELPALLKKRPNVTMTFCAKANGADREALLADQPSLAIERQRAGEQQGDSGQEINGVNAVQKALRSLALARGTAIKRYLIEAGVAGEQVALCEPELELDIVEPPEVSVAL